MINEKTLTPNELDKREEIVKSLKNKRSDFVKRYGKERADSVMYATATKTAKAVTEENEPGPIERDSTEGLGKKKKSSAMLLATITRIMSKTARLGK